MILTYDNWGNLVTWNNNFKIISVNQETILHLVLISKQCLMCVNTKKKNRVGKTHAILLICHSSISLCCRIRHLIRCICSTPPAVCPSCWWERTPGRTDSSLKDTDSITEPNKDRHTDQNSITFKDGRGMFAGESHHTFRFFNVHVEASKPMKG